MTMRTKSSAPMPEARMAVISAIGGEAGEAEQDADQDGHRDGDDQGVQGGCRAMMRATSDIEAESRTTRSRILPRSRR